MELRSAAGTLSVREVTRGAKPASTALKAALGLIQDLMPIAGVYEDRHLGKPIGVRKS